MLSVIILSIKVLCVFVCVCVVKCHDSEHNDTQHNDAQHNGHIATHSTTIWFTQYAEQPFYCNSE